MEVLELKNTITEINNSLDGLSSRMEIETTKEAMNLRREQEKLSNLNHRAVG